MISRRNFIKGTIAASVLTIIPRHVLGGTHFVAPSDQINIGFIGTGKQARESLLPPFANRARIIALCDVDQTKLKRFQSEAEALYAKRGLDAKGMTLYGDFRELLQNKEVDGVVIATPDHWHAINLIEAAKAGKDIYCEKPFSHSIQEGRLMVDAVKKYQRVCQVGSMQRSWHNFWHAAQVVRNGFLGDIDLIRVYTGGTYSVFPQPCNLPDQLCPETLNWDMWIGPARYRAYHEELAPSLKNDFWAKWRMYRDYGNGNIGDWGAHMFDIIQWALDKDNSGPVAVMPSGKDYGHLSYLYDNGTRVVFEDFHRGRGVQFIGSKGTLTITREFYETTPTELKDYMFADREKTLYESTDHYTNWLECMKSRKDPVATAEIGHRTATVGHLSIIANRLKRTLRWDPKSEQFIGDEEANQLAKAYVRKPWSLEI